MQERTVQREDGREGALKLLLGRICCVVGLLLSAGGFVVATLGASVNLSAGAVGIGLGVLGYFLGASARGASVRRVSSLALPRSSSWRPQAQASSPAWRPWVTDTTSPLGPCLKPAIHRRA
jgi:hypothetical protein